MQQPPANQITAPLTSVHDGVPHTPHGEGTVYFRVFLALCGFTVLSVVADLLHLAQHCMLATIVLSVAFAKALCVMLYFMHLKFERGWKYLLLGPTLLLAGGMIVGLSPDISMHYYSQDIPQLHMIPGEGTVAAPVATGH